MTMSDKIPGFKRIGLIVIDNDAIPELEIRPENDNDACVIVSRFVLNRNRGEVYLGEIRQQGVPHEIKACLSQLERIGVDAVGLCFTSSSVFAPKTFDRLFQEAAHETNSQWEAVTAGQAIVEQLQTSTSTNPFIVVPPWFSQETVDAAIDYIEVHGIGHSGWYRYQLHHCWDGIPSQDLFDRGAGWAIDPSSLVDQVLKRLPSSADSILIPGSGFQSKKASAIMNEMTDLPIISANSSIKRRILGAG